ncbi:hypothetical protein EB796_005546 [Bugula neritina]|uniref:Uncharacterized protein n=1 Tax=Bugula neritina TaxID=10212 RepID=A0A7J7KE66_BUGNE|nr:hypothetical protein EB796_005546 [Bugula neritina]
MTCILKSWLSLQLSAPHPLRREAGLSILWEKEKPLPIAHMFSAAIPALVGAILIFWKSYHWNDCQQERTQAL